MKKMFWMAVLAIFTLDLSSCWVDRGDTYYYKRYDRRHEHDHGYAHNR